MTPSILRGALPLAFALLALAGIGCAHRGAPKAYPEIDAATARASLVVVELLATDYLPPFPDCASEDVICFDPPPTWVKFRTLQPVYGDATAPTFYASTTSHYGKMDAYGLADGPMLVLLLTQGGSTVMSRYGRAMLQTDSAGGQHLVLHDAGPHWLPCSVSTLREPISDPRLLRKTALTREHYEQFHADRAADFFQVRGESAQPRFSVPIARLRAHLADRTLKSEDFRCLRRAD